MANPHRGEVALTVGGNEYRLALSINAICELEEMVGKGINAIAADLKSPPLRLVRAVLWAALREHCRGVTLEGAGRIIEQAGMEAVTDAIGQAFLRAFPEAADDGKANPPPGVDGAG